MRLLIAGGGTGGHLFPGIAVAEEITARRGEVLFVGTARGLEARVVPAAGYQLRVLDVSGLARMGVAGTVRGLVRLPGALAESLAILRSFRPDVVLGVGGYASGPLVLAAALSRYPTAIQEQNSVPGMTNKILGRFARAVFVGFDDAGRAFSPAKVRVTGNPVRRKFLDAVSASGRVRVAGGPPRVLVVGGSQGARAVNDLVLGAAEVLVQRGQLPALVHQTGSADVERCSSRYHALGVADRATVRPFIEDMVSAYRDADLVIGRAGALTLAELAILGRPALLIPLPTAADDHQTRNAEAFAQAGAALVVEQRRATAEGLADSLAALLADAPRRGQMAEAMRALSRPDAAQQIADALAVLAGGSGTP